MTSGHLLIELGAIILGLGLLARIASGWRLSAIPLFLVAGLAFGDGGLMPLDAADDFIEVGAEIGVILLLLLLGLEYTADELVDGLRSGLSIGAVDLVLNATPGVVTGLLLGWTPLAAVVLGGVTYVSSSGVAAKTLSDLGRLGNRETPVVLSLLVTEDLAMAVYLPVVTGLLVGGGVREAAPSVGIAFISAVIIMLSAVRFGPRLSRVLRGTSDEVLLLVVLGMALLVGGLAEGLHVSAGVGAFLVGIALSGPVASGAAGLLAPLRDLFAAVFFAFFGLRIDPGAIPRVLAVAAALAVVTGLTKFATGWLAARRAGIGRHGRFRTGMALIARGEFSIVIAGLAVGAGLEPDLAALAGTYVLLMAIAGPMLTRLERVPTLRRDRGPKYPVETRKRQDSVLLERRSPPPQGSG